MNLAVNSLINVSSTLSTLMDNNRHYLRMNQLHREISINLDSLHRMNFKA